MALGIFVIGLYVLTKNELELTLSAGPTKLNEMVDENSKYTKSKKINLGKTQTKIFACALVATSLLVYANIKGDLVFVW